MLKLKRMKDNINIWTVLSFIFVMLVVLPNIHIIINIFQKPNENWAHIKQYLLKDYVVNSMTLITFTGLFTIFIGTSLAWLISVYDFPLRSFFKWSLVLPLAIPPYIAAYTYNGIFNYTGVIQSFLRNNLNIQVNQKYFNVMSAKGAVFIFTMFLFPYVFIITKSFLEKQAASLIETSRLLGRNSLEIFWHVILPLSRTAIVGGVSLVILEVLNDYGVVKYFGVPTFSTAIFKTWFSMGDIDSAIRLSAVLMAIVFGILLLEKLLRGRKKFGFSTAKVRPIALQKLTGIKGKLVCMYCFLIFSLGFLIPTLQLVHWTSLTYKKILNVKFVGYLMNTLFTASVASVLIIFVALVIANYCRINEGPSSKIFSKITTAGYSIPGAVISVGVIAFFVSADNKLYPLYKMILDNPPKLLMSTSIVMLIFAYLIRFLAIGYNSIEAGFEKVGKRFFEASRTLGMGVTETFFKVDLKMIKAPVVSAFFLVFVDILKELPLTLILRPFNFDTLATRAFEYANDEMIHEASIASLIIIIISVVAVYFFNKIGNEEEA